MQPTQPTTTAPRVLARDLASVATRRARHARRLGPPTPRPRERHVPRAARPRGLAQVVVKDRRRHRAARRAARGDRRRGDRHACRPTRRRPAVPSSSSRSVTRAHRARAAPPAELWRPTFGAGLPTHLDHAAVTLRHPRHRAAWQIASASMRGFRSALGRARVHRDRDTEARRHRDRVGRERLHRRLLRSHGLPRAEPAALQADARRGLRAGLRGRSGLPRRAARHGAPPRAVHLARRRARLHPRPPRRARRPARGHRRDGRGHRDVCRRRRCAPRRRAARGCPRSSPSSTSATPWRRWAPTRTSRTSARRTSARSASGPRRHTTRTSLRWRATRWPSGRSTRTRSRATSGGATASTCSSGGSS